MDADKLRATLAATSALRSRGEVRQPRLSITGFTRPAVQPLMGLSLIEALLVLSDELGHAAERDQLLAALPMLEDDINPVAAPLALARVDLHGTWCDVTRKVQLCKLLPCIVTLRSGGYAVAIQQAEGSHIQIRAAGFSRVATPADLMRQIKASCLHVQTRAVSNAAAAAAPRTRRSPLADSLRHVLRQPVARQSYPTLRLASSFVFVAFLVAVVTVAVRALSVAGNGSLLTIPLAALVSGGMAFVLHIWRRQRDWQTAPQIVSALRGVFLRGSLMRQTIGQDNLEKMSRSSVNYLLSAMRTPLVDMPVALIGLAAAAWITPVWMVEAYFPALALLIYAGLSLFKQKRHAAGVMRLCRAMTYVADGVSARIRGDLALDSACVTKEGEDALLLDGITLRIRAGERIGIVGAMGSGKSALLRALAGHYALESGRRYVDGQPRAGVTDPLRSEQISYAPPETVLIDGTLGENILMGRPKPLPGMLDWIMRVANLADFAGKHDNAWNMPISAKGTLSTGERHAIGLARALVGDPAVLLLDDPTAAMDAQAERAFLAALLNGSVRSTIVIVSNRQSVLAHLDRIVWLHEGRIIADKGRDAMLQELKQRPAQAVRAVA